MQTPKPNTTKITGLLQKNNREIQLSPYRTKIKNIHSSVQSSISDVQKKINFYKWYSRLSLTTSLFVSTILLSLSFFSPQLSFDNPILFQSLTLSNVGCIFTYTLIQPSSKHILYKEVIDGLQSLHQSIEFYLCKYSEDDYQNYITFESCQTKLLKKLDTL